MILLITPPASAAVHGNGVTAQRWAEILRGFGHEVRVADSYRPGDYRMLVALHARKSAAAIVAFRAEHPRAPVVLALTGTDLYPDLVSSAVDPGVLRIADRLIVLQPHALRQLDDALRSRARVIVQSMPAVPARPQRADVFEVAVLAHLRTVKDPLRAAEATRLLPPGSRILVSHVGAALDDELGGRAAREDAQNPRYDWLGELSRSAALDLLARSRLLVLTSRDEGGANVVSEALAAGVPVVSSAIPGSQGLLGDDYPGYFAVGDTAALADLLYAAETDAGGRYEELVRRCRALRPLVDPRHEQRAWAELLAELSLPITV